MKNPLTTERLESMAQYDFGPEAMKKYKICSVCGTKAGADESFCWECGAELPEKTVFDAYKINHRFCSGCGTVVSEIAQFCPKCGSALNNMKTKTE